MLETLDIDRFRGCEELHIGDLAHVNLIVGRNNSGKTTVLEAIHLLMSAGDPYVLFRSMARRGERHSDENRSRSQYFYDTSHLFHGHKLAEDSGFSIGGTDLHTGRSRWLRCDLENTDSPVLFDESSEEFDNNDLEGQELALKFEGVPDVVMPSLPITPRGAISSDYTRRFPRRAVELELPVEFITTDIASADSLMRVWRDVVLTDEEDLITDALSILEPAIERVAILGDEYPQRLPSRTGVLVKVRGYTQPIPLGSMGEGMWRMLLMSLALVRSANGFLLIDEIDTGLHHSVMRQMWTLVSQTASRLHVQVFATTHSNDCVDALASVLRTKDLKGHAALHRIEKDKKYSVRYSEEEIIEAAAHGAEVR